MHIRLVQDYIRKRLRDRGLTPNKCIWNEDYIRFSLNNPSTSLITLYEFYTNNYIYVLDNWAQTKVFYNVGTGYNIQILGDYSYRLYQGSSRVAKNVGINEFTGNIRIRTELLSPMYTEDFITIPVIIVQPHSRILPKSCLP